MDLESVLAAARSSIAVVGDRVAAVVRSAPHPEQRIAGSEWCIREAAIHIVTDTVIHADLALGEPMPRTDLSKAGIALENERLIAGISETGPEALSALILDAVARFLDATAGRSSEDEVDYGYPGAGVTLAHLACLELSELVLHGYDIAATACVPWLIDPADAGLILFGYGPLYAPIVNAELARGLTVGVGVEIRSAATFTVRFVDGQFTMEPPGSGPVDCTISADPVAFLLVVSGRLSQFAAIALGLLAAAGDRPELALGLTELFIYP